MRQIYSNRRHIIRYICYSQAERSRCSDTSTAFRTSSSITITENNRNTDRRIL